MLDDKKFEEECRFVVAHFKEGAFRTKELFESKVAFRNRRKIAIRWGAASLIAVTLSATAIITYKIRSVEPDEVTTEQCIVDKADNSKAMEIIRLEFNDAKLSDVIKAVEEGILSLERVNESLRRIFYVKQQIKIRMESSTESP